MNKYKQELPPEVEQRLDAYIERIKAIRWFQPSADLKKADIEKQVHLTLEAFGVKATIEYRSLRTSFDWDAARDAARGAVWGTARDAVWDAAWGAVWGTARDAVWDAARGAVWDAVWGTARDAVWDAARDAAWGAADTLVADLDEYKKKYPNGNFINLIPLWESGLYPIGVVDGKFVVYVPPSTLEFPNELTNLS